jgi:transposase
MPRAYSSDLRERVVTDCEAGLGRAETARRYRLGARTVYRWLAAARDEGRRHAKPHAGGRRPVVAGTEDVLHELATGPATRDATLAEQVELYEARTDRTLSAATLCRAFQRLGLTRKKRLCAPPSRIGRRSGPSGRRSSNGRTVSTRAGWCSSMRPA